MNCTYTFLLCGLVLFNLFTRFPPPVETDILTSAWQTRQAPLSYICKLWDLHLYSLPGAESCARVPKVDAVAQCEATHRVSPARCPRCSICLPPHALSVCALGEASGLLFPLPLSNCPRQTAAHGGFPLSLKIGMFYSWSADYFSFRNSCHIIIFQKINFHKQQLMFLLKTPTPSQIRSY